MDTRQKELLNLVVDSYIKTAEPIWSRFLLGKGKLDVGEATVRNDLRALEEEGYLTHPHTSAGRIPTEKGYRMYLGELDLGKAKISKKDNDVLGMPLQNNETEVGYKELAKALAELSEETVILAFSPEKVYYTGLSNLFSKPEFRELEMVADLSHIFDHCEECLSKFFDEVNEEPKYFFGKEHGFGGALSVLAFRFGDDSLLALLGPMRMNYARNLCLVNKVKELL